VAAQEQSAIRQLKVLEERSVNLRKKAQLADENLLAAEAKLRDEIKLVTSELSELRHRLTDIEEGLRVVEDEMKHSAKIQDVRALEKYLAYWEPLQFVTQAELARRQNLLKEQGSKALQEEAAPTTINTKTPRITR
jgi:hypothetical protein